MHHVRENACPEDNTSLLIRHFHISTLALSLLLLLPSLGYCQSSNPPAATPPAAPQPQPTVRIMQIVPFGVPLSGAATITGKVPYWSGPVISNAQLVVVYWGPNVSAVVKPAIEPFYQDVTNTTYFDLFNEYSTVGLTGSGGAAGSNQTIGRGTYGGAFQITPTKCASATACSLTDTDIQTELLAQVNAAVLPSPAVDAQGNVNTLFMVYFPPNVTISVGGTNSCQTGGFCAYHSNTSSNNLINNKTLLYGVMPDFGVGSGCDLGCGAGTQFQNVTSASSHEMGEAVTDPEVGTATTFAPPLAWNDNTNGEIGDVCNQNVSQLTVGANTYTVQQQWSDLQVACASAPAKLSVSAPASTSSGTAISVSVTAQDSSGAITLTGYTGTIHFTSSDPLAVLPADFTFTGVDAGTHTFSVTLKTTGAQSITAQDTRAGVVLGSANVSVSSAAATHFTLTAPASVNAGTSLQLIVTALDGANNTATGYSGTVHFTSSDAAAVLPANATLTNGTGSFSASLNTAGAQTITATDTVTPSITGSTSLNVSVPDLTISKTHTGNFTQGQTDATYTITVSNAGAAPTSGTVTVVDSLPVGLTFHRGANLLGGTGWTCDFITLTCTRADSLAPGASYPPITLTLTVDQNAPASVTNSVSVSGGGEANTANDTATDPTTIIQVADLTIAKSHTGSFTQGQTGAQYTLTASNVGPGPTSGIVTVADALPSGLTATAIGGTGWNCVLATLNCTRSDVLAAGAAYPNITLTVNVASNASAALTNTATIFGGGELNAANDTATDPTTVIQLPDLTLSKTHTGTFTQGQAGATYQITVSNAGAAASSGSVAVVDSLPAGLTPTAISGTGWSCVLVPTVSCTRADALAINTAYPAITVTVDVAANAPGSVTNTATVSGGGEANTVNDTATDVTAITQVADLTVSKSHNGNFAQGQTGATYFLNVNNLGPGPTSGTVTVTDTLPAGLSATAISGSGWTCVLATLTCTRSDALPSNGSYSTVTLTVDVAANASASVTNSATVSGGGELNTANDSAADVTIITPAPDLTISSTHTGNFTQGETGASYTLTVSNAGPGTTSGAITVADTLPAGLSATSIAGSGWTCVLASLTCTRADALAANGSYPAVTITANVAANAAASVTNTATVSGGGELNTSNDVAADATTIVPAADLTIAIVHSGTLSSGQTGAMYTIVVTNSGQGPTAGTVSVVDSFPANGVTATAISGTGWTCVLATLTCTRADVLAAGASYPGITVTVNVASNAPSPLTNSASVSGGGELNTSNDAASDSATLAPPASLTASASSSATVTAGSAASFTFSFTSNQATAVTFSCSGLPSAAVCSFNPQTTSSTSAQVTMTISTTASSAMPGTGWSPRDPNPYIPVIAILGLLLLPMVMRRKLALRWGLSWAGLMFVLALAGCGGHAAPPPPPHVAGTPAGTYQITATATGTGIQTSSVVTLKVQ